MIDFRCFRHHLIANGTRFPGNGRKLRKSIKGRRPKLCATTSRHHCRTVRTTIESGRIAAKETRNKPPSTLPAQPLCFKTTYQLETWPCELSLGRGVDPRILLVPNGPTVEVFEFRGRITRDNRLRRTIADDVFARICMSPLYHNDAFHVTSPLALEGVTTPVHSGLGSSSRR